jgi:uncharacterized protein YndB with AHSA1/START domain
MTTMTRHGSANVTTPSDRETLIIRTFDAPAVAVFDAWTTPEHLLNWWGSKDAPMVECARSPLMARALGVRIRAAPSRMIRFRGAQIRCSSSV